MLHIKANQACSNMAANILPTDTLETSEVASKGQTISFSERSHAAYQIKGNLAKSTMKANMLSTHPGVGSKGQIFLAHPSHWLMVSYCDRWMYVMCRQQLLKRTFYCSNITTTYSLNMLLMVDRFLFSIQSEMRG